MNYEFKGEYHCSGEWDDHPHMAVLTISETLFKAIPEIAAMLTAHGLSAAVKWYAADHTFLDEDEIEMNPDYSVDGCSLKIYADGDIQFEFPFKHTADKGWCGNFKLTDAIAVEEHTHV